MNNQYKRLGISLSEKEKKQIIDDIIYFFETERDEKLGIIGSESILDLFMDTLGTTIYNKALDDAKKWYDIRMEDVEADFYSLYKQQP